MKALALIIFLALAGCNTTTDVFCQTHTQDQFTPSATTFQVMTPQEKRNTLEILNEGKARCGWKPSR